MLGGNTDDAWGYGSFDPATITGYWWPKVVALPKIEAVRIAFNGATSVSEV